MAEIQSETYDRRLVALPSAFVCTACQLSRAKSDGRAKRFGLYFGHPWTDVSYFCAFENTFSKFYKLYVANIFSQSFVKNSTAGYWLGVVIFQFFYLYLLLILNWLSLRENV
jgi:hypothetical protein